MPSAHVMGNADRELLLTASACRGCASAGDDPMAQGALWAAAQLGDDDRAFLSSFEASLTLEWTAWASRCSATARRLSDEEGIT